MKILGKHLLVAAGLSMTASVAGATIVGGAITGGNVLGSGTFVKLDPSTGFTIGNDNFEDDNLYAFDEDQNITITGAIAVDIGASPVAGDVVASHYIGFDPASANPARTQVGYIDFDADIFGIATSTATLAASDFLANTAVTYLNPAQRGLEPWQDTVWIDLLDPRRLWVDWLATTPGDYVRVFTKHSPLAPVPLPATGLLLLGAIGGLGLKRRKKH